MEHRIMTCVCRCHVGGVHVSCNVDAGTSGVPGVAYCGPHTGDEQVDATLCVNDHAERQRDGSPEQPAKAERGRLCVRCARKLEEWLRDIEIDFALLPTVVMPGSVQHSGAKHTKGSEAPAPVRLDVVALTDSDRVVLDPDGWRMPLPYAELRAAGEQTSTQELPDVPRVYASVERIAARLRLELAA